ncbi:hypothetical protein [Neptunicoccus cionae]|uniref:hypothetical protein n=1 Tax=Neptunicoccus cionae TaxID=2035344 RepID=UPI000C758C15|nr:hypothetical protein [Amylibacter cionae]PLS21822.1 hypothetical protein C0U40_10080 [Amylibacter cionae]
MVRKKYFKNKNLFTFLGNSGSPLPFSLGGAALLLITVMFSIGAVRLAAAQDESLLVQNDRDISEYIEACDSYKLFLELKPVDEANIETCHPFNQAIIELGELPTSEFLNILKENIDPVTSFGATVLTLDVVSRGNAVSVFAQSEIAGRKEAMRMGGSGDIERATLYSHLLFGIQLQSFQQLCEERFNCGELQNFARISEMFGSEFGFLDPVAPQSALLCLVKTDGYVVPLRTVLASPRFRDCISK